MYLVSTRLQVPTYHDSFLEDCLKSIQGFHVGMSWLCKFLVCWTPENLILDMLLHDRSSKFQILELCIYKFDQVLASCTFPYGFFMACSSA